MAEIIRKQLWYPGYKPENLSGVVEKLKEVGASNDESALGTFKIKLRPTAYQKACLKRVLAASNLAWNWTKWLIEEKGVSWKDKKTMQAIVVKKSIESLENQDMVAPEVRANQQLLSKTTSVRLTAMCSFVAATKSSMTLHKGCTRKFDVGYKELYPRSGTFGVQKPYIRKFEESMLPAKMPTEARKNFNRLRLSILPNSFAAKGNPNERFLRIGKRRSWESMPPISHDCKVEMRKDGSWLLLIPCDRSYLRFSKPVAEKNHAVSLDPGVRTFQTEYNPFKQETRNHGSQRDKDRINFFKTKAQRHEVLAKTNKKEYVRKEHKRQADKYWHKHGKYRDNIHRELASKLVNENDLVIVGDFSSSRCAAKRAGSKLTKQTRAEMYSWAHYRFKQRLIERARGTGTRVHFQDESYTSKTCGNCGNIKEDLGGNKTYACEVCGVVMDRDVNGARNIMIKSLTKN
ncbi:hypothetical protein EGW08_022613 [Elysia chlorotica]|uniref:Transposase n=1 Tax=Elysia chlorotica TaxID=188477 RepID=A0A3S1H075_ELYCH|nr:hypothetical protein EGW08_022613 [Elysia chlorotica]